VCTNGGKDTQENKGHQDGFVTFVSFVVFVTFVISV
jgi:hypothetical protein